ncbi:hypothetical protein CL6EHI_137270 [Entamoeba histolytica]|uniref:Uncharacterized protein n=2 Tax=Entamoeba histolytica TaxID=5759 RepID=C4M5X5_ENTH1|nr:hypothetical protein EHI_137270 [Entamoeba histolytica HM-1:IMSS]XP_652596.1 hypothetical protein EHI_137010 [Entamoeba histolytica HM-1:IMSS]GAT96846.1 hypothetical protein CL6EHI_137010 [Entamoeba histolytica]EAL47193.1 hypothetical protein EHI_137270 [Entamoeba histolytica HM-1:IMSS]EAL47210.1 hypothetical protein EHI_137010 [Entamoeba histolytica HM-1:IMSS]GAT96861.1 hypothetical protein CL6EHI_137270 [Entamoeba histolytica]|eukprot:XP_652579.1 hypothetical protein EHI_137270 [Entamoeba histolytica HM-1:IMSS]
MSGKKLPYIEFKNYQVYQESILIGIIALYGTINISIRGKKTDKEILPFLLINKIQIYGEDPIYCNDLITTKCEDIKFYEIKHGLNIKTALRRFHKNKIIESLHFLMDILFLLGINFNTYITNGKNGAIRAETIRFIHLQNGRLLSSDDIKHIGNLIYHSIIDNLKFHQSVSLNPTHPLLSHLFDHPSSTSSISLSSSCLPLSIPSLSTHSFSSV